MRFKGEEAYRTFTGGFFYLILMCFVTWFTVGQVVELVTMSDPSTQVHTVYHKASDVGTRTGKEMHFDIGIGAYDF